MPALKRNIKALIAATVVCSAVPAHASFVLAFNRDRTPMEHFDSLSVTQQDLTATISRGADGFTFDNMYHNPGAEIFGARSLTTGDTNDTPFVVDFSHPVTNFSVDVAHLGGTDTAAWLEGFSGPSGTGKLIASDNNVVPTASGFAVIELSTLAGGIQSVSFGSRGSGETTPVYFDNLTVQDLPAPGDGGNPAVPLPPASCAAIATAALAFFAHRRTNRAT
jgi:hypothetical protein